MVPTKSNKAWSSKVGRSPFNIPTIYSQMEMQWKEASVSSPRTQQEIHPLLFCITYEISQFHRQPITCRETRPCHYVDPLLQDGGIEIIHKPNKSIHSRYPSPIKTVSVTGCLQRKATERQNES